MMKPWMIEAMTLKGTSIINSGGTILCIGPRTRRVWLLCVEGRREIQKKLKVQETVWSGRGNFTVIRPNQPYALNCKLLTSYCGSYADYKATSSVPAKEVLFNLRTFG